MTGHRVAHVNEYLSEAQWPPSEVVRLGQQVPRTNVCAHHLQEDQEWHTGVCVQVVCSEHLCLSVEVHICQGGP